MFRRDVLKSMKAVIRLVCGNWYIFSFSFFAQLIQREGGGKLSCVMRKNRRNSERIGGDSNFPLIRRPCRRGGARRCSVVATSRPFAALLISSKSSQRYYVTSECTDRRNSMQYSPSPSASLCHYSCVPRNSPACTHFPFRYQPAMRLLLGRSRIAFFSHWLIDLPCVSDFPTSISIWVCYVKNSMPVLKPFTLV